MLFMISEVKKIEKNISNPKKISLGCKLFETAKDETMKNIA